jgi:hypothetical protein
MISNIFKAAIVSMALTIPAASFAAGAQELVGKWSSACEAASSDGKYFVDGISEFRIDMTLAIQNRLYTNSTCSGAPEQEATMTVTYGVQDTTLSLVGDSDGHKFEISGPFAIVADELTFTPSNVIVDGAAQAPGGPTTMKRIP